MGGPSPPSPLRRRLTFILDSRPGISYGRVGTVTGRVVLLVVDVEVLVDVDVDVLDVVVLDVGVVPD